MNEQNLKNSGLLEGIIGVVVFVGFIIFLYTRFGTTKLSIPPKQEQEKQDSLYESAVYQNYSDNLKLSLTDQEKEAVKKNLALELENKTLIQVSPTEIKNIVADSYKPQYENQVMSEISSATSSGVGFEMVLFLAQIDPSDNNLLPLADSDKVNILEISKRYKKLSDTISILPTPKTYSSTASELSTSLNRVAYILEKMMGEQDPLVYAAWNQKYLLERSTISKNNLIKLSISSKSTSKGFGEIESLLLQISKNSNSTNTKYFEYLNNLIYKSGQKTLLEIEK